MKVELDHPINPHPDEFGALPVPKDMHQWQKDLCERIRQAALRGERLYMPRINGKASLVKWMQEYRKWLNSPAWEAATKEYCRELNGGSEESCSKK